MSDKMGNPYLRNALESIPEYPRAVALRAKALEAQQTLRGVQVPAQPTDPDADLSKWLTAVGEATVATVALEAQRGALAP